VSPTVVVATIPSTLLSKQGKLTIAIQNPPPGGGSSNGVDLTVY